MNSPVRTGLTSLETLLRDATLSQRREIETAASENESEIETLANRVLNDPEIKNPIACFLSKLRSGTHRAGAARTDGFRSTEEWRSYDPVLAEANAERARALIQRLTGKPTMLDTHTTSEDDDIPGYGDDT